MDVILKPVVWLSSTKKDLLALPKEVRGKVGFALYQAQSGQMPEDAKPLKGFGGASVQEIMVDYDRDTFRAVYTVRFVERIYMLHVFQKKSKSALPRRSATLTLLNAASSWRSRWRKTGGRNHDQTPHP